MVSAQVVVVTLYMLGMLATWWRPFWHRGSGYTWEQLAEHAGASGVPVQSLAVARFALASVWPAMLLKGPP